jgi:signal transduction histidine kinase
MLAHEEHLKQLWTNLLSNAIKYTPSGGTVVASLDQKDEQIVGKVSDTGIGIALPIVGEIVEAYGGTIDVHSKLGEGTIFTFTLPQTMKPEDDALEKGKVVGT